MSAKGFASAAGANLAGVEAWAREAPMGAWLGFSATKDASGLLYRLAFDEHHIGNAVIRALHGGVISSFLQTCAEREVCARMPEGLAAHAISVHCTYLRSAKGADMVGRAEIVRTGRRMAFVEVTGWQESEDKPTARAAVAIRLMAAQAAGD